MMLTDGERGRVTQPDAAIDLDMSGQRGRPIGALMSELAAAAPDRPALTVGAITLSRDQLDRRANRRARALAAMGVGKDDFVVIMLPNGIEFVETVIALWKLGASPAPVSWRLPHIEAEAIVALIGPKLIVGADPAQFPGVRTLAAGFVPDDALDDGPLPIAVASQWKAVTSGGSTGRPKVIVDHMPSIWDPDSVALGRGPGQVVLNPGPLYHNGPFTLSMGALFGGCHLVCMTRFDAAEWLSLVERHRVQWGYLVPTMMNRIWRAPERPGADMSSLSMIVHMAAPCPVWLKRAWIEWLGPDRIGETYAGTESVGGCFNSGHDWLEHPGTVGKPMGDCRVLILDENGEELPEGEVGEIYFEPSARSGAGFHYLGGEPRESGGRKGYGDLGWLDADGFLYIADRRTDLIVSGGANIYPAEVESALEAHPHVRSAIAIGLPDDDLGQRVHAIVDTPEGGLDDVGLVAFLRDRLVSYKLPRSFEYVSQPLRDDAGKARRGQLRDERIAMMQAG